LAASTQAARVSSATSSPAAVGSMKPETPASVTLPAVPGRQENPMWILLSGIAALLAAIVYVIWKKRKRAA
jgi:LPXTG-motif cell wall-anchored protein